MQSACAYAKRGCRKVSPYSFTAQGRTFWTQEQPDLGAIRCYPEGDHAFHQEPKSLEFDDRPKPILFGIGGSLMVKPGTPHPIKYSREKQKELALANAADSELANHLIGDALENVASTFDGFGPEIGSHKSADIRFQNTAGAKRKVQETFGFDFANSLGLDQWMSACRIFQKRHLRAHKMG